MKILVIAQVAHAINAAYCLSLGDTSQVAWEEAPEWQQKSAIAGVEMHLANPDATPEQSHESWLAAKLADGWTYGEVKDETAKTHPCCLPWDELPATQKSKDYLFRAVVHALKGIPDADEAVAAALAKLPKVVGRAQKDAASASAASPLGYIAVEYVGRKTTYTDHLYGTGLSFDQGQVRSMPGELARKFLKHGDMFKEAGASTEPAQAAPTAPAQDDTAEQLAKAQAQKDEQQQEQNALQDLHDSINAMAKNSLVDYAKVNYRIDLDKTKKVGELRTQVIGLINQYGAV